MLIALNVLFIGITAYYQPYLTDGEFLKIRRFGRKQANVQRNSKCTKQGFGVNNSLDILLLVGETCICISSLIAYSVESTMRSEAENSPLTTNANATASSFQQEPLAKRIAKQFPVANTTIAIFDILGLTIFLCGFLYFLKEIFVYVCGTLCTRRHGHDSSSERTAEKSSTKVVPVEAIA